MNRLVTIRDIAQMITAGGAAGATLYGAYLWLGPTAAVAAGSAALAVMLLILGQRLYRALLRVEATVQRVDYHLGPNGEEYRLPEHLRGKPIRTLVASSIERLALGDQRFDRQDREIAAIGTLIEEQIEIAHTEHARIGRQIAAIRTRHEEDAGI